MSRSDWLTVGVSAVCVGITLLWVSPIWAFVFVLIGVVFLVKTSSTSTETVAPFTTLGIPRPSPLEVVQLSELELEQQTRSLAQIICIYADNEKKRFKSTLVYFPDEQLRLVLGNDGDRMHAAMNYLVGIGRAKRASLPGYWEIH